MAKKQVKQIKQRVLKENEVHHSDLARGTSFVYGKDYHVVKNEDQSETFVPLSKECKAVLR